MFESIASKYIEVVSSRLPARHALCFVIGLLLWSHAVKSEQGVVIGVMDLKLNDFISLEFWRSLDIGVGSVFLALVFVLFGVISSKVIARLIFYLIDRSAKFKLRVSDTYDRWSLSEASMDDRLKMLELTAKLEDRVRRVLGGYVGLSQSSSSIAGYLALEGYLGLDTVVFALLSIVALLAIIKSVQFFISEYYPVIAFRERVAGAGSVEFGEM